LRLLKEPKLGAPELAAAEWAGEPTYLGALRGRVVLLDFFSYGDPEGYRALRWIRAFADHYREHGLTVLGVHVPAYGFERPVESARREVWRLGIPWPVALDHDLSITRAYENRDLPGRYLVDARGSVRGWHHGPGGHETIEAAARTLLREARPERSLPARLEPLPGFLSPGRPSWLPTAEVRFGARAQGFARPPEASGDSATEPPAPAAEGDVREFEPPPELRAEGRAYLTGSWRLEADAVVSRGEGSVSIVFEGASVAAVLSRPATDEPEEEDPTVDLRLDGEPVPDPWKGADVEGEADVSRVRIDRGSVYEWIDGMPFGVHHLDARVSGPGVALHLLSFGTTVVPEED
jgi:hypothetical protein